MRSSTHKSGLSFSIAVLLLVHSIGLSHLAFGRDHEPTFDELLNLSKIAPVPQRVQIGGTCGLYALGMVMDYWHEMNSSNPTVLVSDHDVEGRGIQFNFDPTSQERILNYVEVAGFTREGEMFDAADLAKTAVHFGYRASYYPHATLNDIYRMLDQKHPAIVAFDVDDQGNPGLFQGERAHYAVLEGYFDYHQTRYIIARHGWGKKTDYVWKANDLFASMKNLEYTDYYPSVTEEPSAIHLPSYDNQDNLEDISQSLGDKVIEVVPEAESPVGGVVPLL